VIGTFIAEQSRALAKTSPQMPMVSDGGKRHRIGGSGRMKLSSGGSSFKPKQKIYHAREAAREKMVELLPWLFARSDESLVMESVLSVTPGNQSFGSKTHTIFSRNSRHETIRHRGG
jgi:hypothetical protein